MPKSKAGNKDNAKNDTLPTYRCTTIGIELSEPAKYISGSDGGFSIYADVNLKNKYFPNIELGRSHYDHSSSLADFKTNGTYIKLGILKALSYYGSKADNMVYTGIHFGFTAFSYDLNNITYKDDYWNYNYTYSLHNEKAQIGWIDIVGGIKVNITGPFSLGWYISYAWRIINNNGKESNPMYVPGYGRNESHNPLIKGYIYYTF